MPPRTKMTALTHAKYTKTGAQPVPTAEERAHREEERFRKDLVPVVANVGVIVIVNEEGSMTFLYVPLVHPSWKRVTAHISALPSNMGEHINFINVFHDYIGKHGCFDDDDDDSVTKAREAICAMVPNADRRAWAALENIWAAYQPHFISSEIIFMPSWS